jgi:hypothetical protein
MPADPALWKGLERGLGMGGVLGVAGMDVAERRGLVGEVSRPAALGGSHSCCSKHSISCSTRWNLLQILSTCQHNATLQYIT